MKRIVRPNDEVRQVEVEVSSQGDAAEWLIGASRWRMQRVSARWELYRCANDADVLEGRFRAMDDAVSFSLGWCRGLVAAGYVLSAAFVRELGADFVARETLSRTERKGVDDGK